MDLTKIKLGSLVEGPAVFAPLSSTERVCLTAVKITPAPTLRVEFKVTLFGVLVGFVTASGGPQLTWEWRK